ncbi:hypothetical protein EX895_003362 [Sporisorium graminicola]|uniref:Uncharacterized protein n=1 Tax=Sporisorium graminicola TaxID=280036 RepID=A0A4U7KTD9_9BASI|nr:hypothetical protein EX895_003362 [Sporisorium graminicola]TKY87781.1 hypothetical protein EX895_003362 [Sporisorium graminicola]
MSSPIFASPPLSGVGDARHRSASFGGPRLDLVLRPSYALGPFKLGHSLWHVLNYLRSHQSLFPQINITYDESAPRLSPIVVVIQPNIHLVFNGVTQRLNMITLENLDVPNESRSAPHAAASTTSPEPSHRPVNLIYNGKLIFSKGSPRSAPVALNRSTLHQILGPTYPGHPESSSVSSDSLVASAFGTKANGTDKDLKEFIISYPGLAFCFAVKSSGAKDADVDKFQPVSSMHIFAGSDLNNPDDVLVFPSAALSSGEAARPAARSSKGTLSPPAAVSDYQQLNSERDRASLDIDAVQIRCPTLVEAGITPGRGVSLHFAKSGVARAPSPPLDRSKAVASPHGQATHAVELLLGITTPQDALCDLGQPQRIFYKEDDRMRIHDAAAGHGGGRGGREGASEASNSTDDSAFGSGENDDSAFFYNYFDLGIDLLFSKNTSRMPSIAEAYDAAAGGQPRLEKVVCHTNVPGDALFQRYNRCPWRVSSSSSSGTSASSANGSKGTSKSKASKPITEGFTFEDHFDSTLSAGQDDRGMELDRGTCAEFKGSVGGGGISAVKNSTAGRQHLTSKQDGLDSSPEREHNPSSEVIVDLSTRLVGRQGMVLEVGKDGTMVGVVVF